MKPRRRPTRAALRCALMLVVAAAARSTAFGADSTTSTATRTPLAKIHSISPLPSRATPAPLKVTTPPSKLIIDGSDDFQRGDFPGAVQAYEHLVEEDPYDPQVLYNLSTAYARAGDYGLAVWRLLQARRYAPRDPDIRHNLAVLAPQLDAQIALTPFPPVNWLFIYFSTNEWAWIAVGFTMAALLLGAARLGLRRGSWLRRASGRLVWALAIAALLVYPPAALHYYDDAFVEKGVIVSEGTPVRTGPHENQIETGNLQAGTVVRLEGQAGPDWVKINFASDHVGFIPRSAVRYL